MIQATNRKRTRQSPEVRRQQMLDAALELFATRGYDETGVGDIAATAGVAVGTLYLYFPSKEHVLNGLHARFHQGLRRFLLDVRAELSERSERGEPLSHAEAIAGVIDEMAVYMAAHRRYSKVVSRYAPRLPECASDEDAATEDLLATMMREGIERGAMHTSDPEMTARLIDAAVGHTMAEAAARGEDLARLAAQAKEFLTKALAP